MAMSKPVIGVIEWSSDSAQEPAVFLASNAADLRREVVKYLRPMLPNEVNYITAAWLEQFPIPADDADDKTRGEWLAELHGETTDAWLTIFYHGKEVNAETYMDVRR